jgi:AAA domain
MSDEWPLEPAPPLTAEQREGFERAWQEREARRNGGEPGDSGFHPLGIERAGIENQGVPWDPSNEVRQGPPTGTPLPFQLLSVMVEKAPAEPEWRWRGYLAAYVLVLLAGRPKVGKSTLMMALVAAAVAGEAFLGLEAKARGVLLLTEERRDTLAEKARILGLVDAEVPVYVLSRGDVRDTPWPEVVRQAMTFCREHELDVLVVDTLDRWTGLRGDAENAAGAVNEAMEPLQFAAAAGLAVLAVSHQRKSGGEYGEAVRGSNAFTGAVDVVIELERPARSLQLGGQARVLRSVSRFSSTPKELFLELGDDGFLPIGDVAEKRSDAERAQVLEVLERHDEPVAVDLLYKETELGKRALRRRLAELREQSLAVRSGEGVKGDPYLWAAVEEMAGLHDLAVPVEQGLYRR